MSLNKLFYQKPQPLTGKELLEVKDFTILLNSLETTQLLQLQQLVTSNRSVIVEFLQSDKKTIWKDKFNLCNHSFLTIRSLLTSVLELTLNGKVSCNFWTCAKGDLSLKLLLPTETDYVGSLSNYLNGSFKPTKSNSWYSTKVWTPLPVQNLQRTSCPSFMYSIVESKEKESTKKTIRARKKKKDPSNSSTKYRLYMNKQVQHELKKWFGCVRKTYNWALQNIKDRNVPINRVWLRNRYVNACNIPKDFKYLLDTPKHVREGAIDELVDAYTLNFKKGTPFDIHFRSKKDIQSIVIPREAIKSYEANLLKLYPTMLSDKIRLYSKTPLKFDYDCRMIQDRLGRFYLCVPRHVSACDNQAGNSIVALDPGVRTFITAFGIKQSETRILKFGDKDITRVYRLCKHLDNLISKKAKTKKKSMTKAAHRLRERIKNLVKDVHWKTASYLCNNFKHIIIPPFKVSQMVLRGKRQIGRKTVRGMLSWSHYAFRERLLYKASLTGCEVHVLGEEYTTKVCTHCGFYNPNIKGNKKIVCPCCGVKIDRDVAGARNILLKNIQAA